MAEEKNLEDKAVEILDKLQEGAGAVAEKLAQLADAHGQEAINLGLNVVRIDNAITVVLGIGLLALAAVYHCILPNRLFKHAISLYKSEKNERFGITSWDNFAFGGGMASLPTAALSLAGLIHVLDIWAWVGMFYPEAVIAKKILGL